jgi:phage anti-repressor protein
MESNTLDIVDLMDNNPIAKLSGTYQSKLLNKIKGEFTDLEQNLFVTSFYCFLNHHPKNDFVIDLDNVWKWVGFAQKVNAKKLLEKQFTVDIDYMRSLCLQQKQKNSGRGGGNKETFLLSVKTFKSLCMKAGTKRAEQIHDYYIKLEEVLQEVCQEESDELKQQLESTELQLESVELQLETAEVDKYKIREKTLIEQFQKNTQCLYYGIIDNVSKDGEKLIKFGISNGLKSRMATHHKTYSNFHLINAFKVQNNLEIENAVKEHAELKPLLRTITIRDCNYIELICVDNLTLSELDKIIKDIIQATEYSYENYTMLMDENRALKKQIAAANEKNKTNDCILLNVEIRHLQAENKILTKSYNALAKDKNAAPINITDENKNKPTSMVQVLKRPVKNKHGTYEINKKKYTKLAGNRTEVFNEVAYKTTGGLIKSDLIINKNGKIISKQKSIQETIYQRLVVCGINKPKETDAP